MNFTLHQLRIFLKVIKCQSITKAAEDLYLTQPAVSIQLKNLQEQFEIPILEVVGRKVFITEFGKEVQKGAERIMAEIEEMDSKAAAFKGQLVGKLKINVVSTGKYIIPSFLTDFIKHHSGIELILDVTNRAKVIKSLENNEVDFALVSVLPANLKVEEIKLMENHLFLVGSSDSVLTSENINGNIFEEIPLIYREQGSATRSIMEKYIQTHNFPVLKKMELTSNEAVKQAVIAGLGYSIMPLIGIRNELRSGELKIIPVKGFPIKTMWRLIWLKNKKASPIAKAYAEFINREKDNIIKEKFGGVSTG